MCDEARRVVAPYREDEKEEAMRMEKRNKKTERLLAAAFLSMVGCSLFRLLPGFEYAGKYEYSIHFLLMFLNINELLKD